MSNRKTIRAFFRSATIDGAQPPYNTLHLKVFYPAHQSGAIAPLGMMPADTEQAPFPVMIWFSGMECGLEQYQWLAVALAERGFVVVLFNWVAENLPGMVSLTPGVDITLWTPATYGTRATASALPAILSVLEDLQQQGVLAEQLDLNRIVLGGHSVGGQVAIQSADPAFFPQVVAAISYGSHTAAPVQMGFSPNRILPLPSALPVLLMGGTRDGVIAQCGDRYGVTAEVAETLVQRTFQEGIATSRNDCYLLLIDGANHFAIANEVDRTTGTAFLDYPATQPSADIRNLMIEAMGLFLDAHVRQNPQASQTLLNLGFVNSLVHHIARK